MSKIPVNFTHWVHLRDFNVFFYQFDGFADVIINGHLKGETCYIEVKAT